jgi:shikimate dehydrogenase
MPRSADLTTKLFLQLGDPLGGARSPSLLNEFFRRNSHDAICAPAEVAEANVLEFVRTARQIRNLSGLLVTMPYKQLAMKFVDKVDITSQLVEAINVVKCCNGVWTGAIFDGLGFVDAFQETGKSVAGSNCLVLGAGGTGRAIGFALAQAGARKIGFFDLEIGRALQVVKDISSHFSSCHVDFENAGPRGYDLVVNATPSGMKAEDKLPFDTAVLDPRTVVFDCVTNPIPTRLSLAARARGCVTIDGDKMHLGQAKRALRFLGFDGSFVVSG